MKIRETLAPLIKNGQVDYPALLTIPSLERIPALALENRQAIHGAISVQLEAALEMFNLSQPMTPIQVVTLADLVIDEAQEDNLSIQDFYIFLGRLVAGKYGPVYNRLDVPTFLEKFELYRQDRHKAYLDARYEADINRKAMGDRTRWTSDEQTPHREALAEHLKTVYQTKPPTE